MPRKQSPVRFPASEISLEALLDHLETELLIIDREYRVQFANSAMLRRVPQKTSVVGRLCYEVLEMRDSPCAAPLWNCPLGRVLQGGEPARVVHPVHYPGDDSRRNRYVEIAMHPLRDEHGEIRALAELRRDATAERELESQILKRHHHLYALNLISGAVSAFWDIDTILRLSLGVALEVVNGEIGGILLFDSKRRWLSYRAYRGLSVAYAEKMRIKVGEGIAGRVAQTGQPIMLEDVSKDTRVVRSDLVSTEGLKGFASVPLKTKDRVVGVMNIASHLPGRFSEDDLYLVSSIGYQIGIAIEQARLYERLMRAGERYRVLLRHSLTAQEKERKRIARELHDETSQSLTSLALSLQAIIGSLEMGVVGPDELLERLRKTHSNAIRAGNEIVKLMKELRPTLLDELGMPTAIRRYARDTLEPLGINVSTEFKGATERRLRTEVEVTLFRVAQGLIGNILEHSQARNVNIELECSAHECALRVEDDGRGFDVKKLTRVDPSGRGAGLFTMKERVRLVGGTCRVHSQPGEGTRVVVRLPVSGDTPYEEDSGLDS